MSYFAEDFGKAEWLIEHGANVNAGMQNWPPLVAATACGNLRLVKLLVKKRVLLGQESGSRYGALYHGILSGNYDTVKFLIENGLSINHIHSGGETVLEQFRMEIATADHDEEAVQMFRRAEKWVLQKGGKTSSELLRARFQKEAANDSKR